jgi:hypothetical protein
VRERLLDQFTSGHAPTSRNDQDALAS